MAESVSSSHNNGNASEDDGKDLLVDGNPDRHVADVQVHGRGQESGVLECAVCLQECVHPVRLPCGHIFCFLCVKGVANQSKRCAMCRKELPLDYLERPYLVGGAAVLEEPPVTFDDGNQWFYEGHNGWWQYDERTSAELEAAFKVGLGTCEFLIAGFLYVIDFQAMVQYRRNDPSRRRRIKRDLVSIPKKGIAGLRVAPNPVAALPASDGEDQLANHSSSSSSGVEARGDQMNMPSISAEQALSQLLLPTSSMVTSTVAAVGRPKSPSVPMAPNNTPQTPHTPSQDSGTSSPTAVCDPSFQNLVQDMEHLLLDSVDDEDEEEEDEDRSPSSNYLQFSRD